MFAVVPEMVQYVYSGLVPEQKFGPTFVGFIIFEIYSNLSMSCVMGSVGFNALMGTLGTNFWLQFNAGYAEIWFFTRYFYIFFNYNDILIL